LLKEQFTKNLRKSCNLKEFKISTRPEDSIVYIEKNIRPIDWKNLDDIKSLLTSFKFSKILEDSVLYVEGIVRSIDWTDPEDLKFILASLKTIRDPLTKLEKVVSDFDISIKEKQTELDKLIIQRTLALDNVNKNIHDWEIVDKFIETTEIEIEYTKEMQNQRQLADERAKLHEKLIEIDSKQVTSSEKLKSIASSRIK